MNINTEYIISIGNQLKEYNEQFTLLYIDALETIEGKAYTHELDKLNLKLNEAATLCDIVVSKINWVESIKNNK